MKQFLLLLFYYLSTSTLQAQVPLFEWSSGMKNANMAFQDMAVLSDQSVVAIATVEELSHFLGERLFVQGDGSACRVKFGNQNATVLLKFDARGKVAWQHVLYDGEGAMYQVETTNQDEIIVLAWVEETYVEEEVDYFEEEEEEESRGRGREDEDNDDEEEGEEESLAGAMLLHFNSGGTETHRTRLDHTNWMDLAYCQFKLHLNGQYLIAGPSEGNEFADQLHLTYPEGMGGEFVAVYAADGELVWGDVIFNKSGGTIIGAFGLATALDGTVYLGGTYGEQALFTDGTQFIVPLSYEQRLKTEGTEAYIVSYAPDGQRNWLKREGSLSTMQGLIANGEGVFVAHRTLGNKLLEAEVDTTSGKYLGLSFITKKGKTKWTKMSGMKVVTDMQLDAKGNAVMLGAYDYHPKSFSILNNEVVTKKHKSILFSLNTKGKIESKHSFRMKLDSNNEPYLLQIDHQGRVYIAAELWITMKMDVQIFEKSLPKLGKASAGVAIIGRLNWKVGD